MDVASAPPPGLPAGRATRAVHALLVAFSRVKIDAKDPFYVAVMGIREYIREITGTGSQFNRRYARAAAERAMLDAGFDPKKKNSAAFRASAALVRRPVAAETWSKLLEDGDTAVGRVDDVVTALLGDTPFDPSMDAPALDNANLLTIFDLALRHGYETVLGQPVLDRMNRQDLALGTEPMTELWKSVFRHGTSSFVDVVIAVHYEAIMINGVNGVLHNARVVAAAAKSTELYKTGTRDPPNNPVARETRRAGEAIMTRQLVAANLFSLDDVMQSAELLTRLANVDHADAIHFLVEREVTPAVPQPVPVNLVSMLVDRNALASLQRIEARTADATFRAQTSKPKSFDMSEILARHGALRAPGLIGPGELSRYYTRGWLAAVAVGLADPEVSERDVRLIAVNHFKFSIGFNEVTSPAEWDVAAALITQITRRGLTMPVRKPPAPKDALARTKPGQIVRKRKQQEEGRVEFVPKPPPPPVPIRVPLLTNDTLGAWVVEHRDPMTPEAFTYLLRGIMLYSLYDTAIALAKRDSVPAVVSELAKINVKESHAYITQIILNANMESITDATTLRTLFETFNDGSINDAIIVFRHVLEYFPRPMPRDTTYGTLAALVDMGTYLLDINEAKIPFNDLEKQRQDYSRRIQELLLRSGAVPADEQERAKTRIARIADDVPPFPPMPPAQALADYVARFVSSHIVEIRNYWASLPRAQRTRDEDRRVSQATLGLIVEYFMPDLVAYLEREGPRAAGAIGSRETALAAEIAEDLQDADEPISPEERDQLARGVGDDDDTSAKEAASFLEDADMPSGEAVSVKFKLDKRYDPKTNVDGLAAADEYLGHLSDPDDEGFNTIGVAFTDEADERFLNMPFISALAKIREINRYLAIVGNSIKGYENPEGDE